MDTRPKIILVRPDDTSEAGLRKLAREVVAGLKEIAPEPRTDAESPPAQDPPSRFIGDGSEIVTDDDPRAAKTAAYIARRDVEHKAMVAKLKAEKAAAAEPPKDPPPNE